MLQIRKTEMAELDRILQVYAQARRFMRANGNPTQWQGGYPYPEVLREDIEAGQLYAAAEEEEIFGVFAFIPGEDPTYGYIEGAWQDDGPYAAIHRVASNGTRKGILAECVAYCARRCPHLRIDTHKDNHVMQNALKKQGFSYCGIIYLETGSPRLAYEWVGQKNM